MEISLFTARNLIYALVAFVGLLIVFSAVRIMMARKRLQENNRSRTAQRDLSRASDAAEPNNQLYIGNLPFSAREDDVEAFFEHYGEVESVRIIRDRRSRRSKGFGFVTYVDTLSATQALELNQEDFCGRALIVRFAKKR